MRYACGQVPQRDPDAPQRVPGVGVLVNVSPERLERQRLAHARWQFAEEVRLALVRINQAQSQALAAGVPAEDLVIIRSEQGVPA